MYNLKVTMQGKLAVLLFVVATTFALPSPRETFKFLRQPSNVGMSISANETVGYLLGQYPLRDYVNARDYCEQRGAVFSELETKEEEEHILKWVHGLGDVEITWVAGKSNGNGSYVWESGLPLRNDTQWLVDEPSERNENGRVALLANENGIGMLTRLQSEEHSCLCEYKDEESFAKVLNL